MANLKNKKFKHIRHAINISDMHSGCKLALCPPKVKLDDGGIYHASAFQLKIYEMWKEFWYDWVPKATHGEPFCVIHNGDSIDGVHHKTVTQISQNFVDQRRVAKMLLQPVYEMCEGRFYMTRGTEAHVGQSGMEEETLAEELRAIPDEDGKFARYELWLRLGGKEGRLCHFLHHIGVTGSSHFETSALNKEYSESCQDAGRWGKEPPIVVSRAHRHRSAQIGLPTKWGLGYCFVTPAWQGKTPLVFRIPGGRITLPQFGGFHIGMNEYDKYYIDSKIYDIERTPEVVI